MTIECEALGMGIQVNEEKGEVALLISLAEHEADEDDVAFVTVQTKNLEAVATKLITLLAEISSINAALDQVEDRPAALQDIIARMQSGTN